MFGSPMFLWALLAAAIPLMLHMFQRRKTVLTPFPTIRFLKAAQKRSSSRVRFENFLLWLLRTLLVVALAIAFAQPILRNLSDNSGWLSRSARDIAIVLDASYSMNYEMDRGKVWQICKDAAVQTVQGLNPGDRVCVYAAGDQPIPVIEKPTTEHATVVSAIQGLECQQGSSRLEDTVAFALHALTQQDDKRARELFVFTDGQALPWQGFRALSEDGTSTNKTESTAAVKITREMRDSVSLFSLLAGAVTPDNAYPADVKVSPSLMLAGQSARIQVRVGRSGPVKQISVALSVDGQESGSRSLTVEPGTEKPLEFVLNNLEPGVHVATVSTPQDSLSVDDSFQFLLRVRKQLPVLVAGPSDSTKYLRAALAPGAADDTVRQVSSSEIESVDLRDYQAVFLCDALPLSGQAIIRLESYVNNGGVVAIFPGDAADFSSYGEFQMLPALPKKATDIAVADAARALKRLPMQPGQQVNFQMALPPGTIPTVALKRVVEFGELAEQAAVLVTAGDDTPFLLGRAIGRGRVFLFGVAATREWSTFPLTAFFVPVVHQLIRQGAGASVQPTHLVLGSSVPTNESIPNFREDDEITTPSGAALQIRDNGNHNFFIESVPEIGIYTRTKASGGAAESVLAVNTDRFESHLDPASPEELREWTGFKKFFAVNDAEELARVVEEHRNGRSFTEVVLWLALLLSLAEWWFANRALRSRKGATENLKVSLSGKVTE